MKIISEARLESILHVILAVAEEVFGHIEAAVKRPLCTFMLQEQMELDLPGGCGKVRLAATFRGEILMARVALSPEAAEKCLAEAVRWADLAYAKAAELDPDAAGALQTFIVKRYSDGTIPTMLYKVSKQGQGVFTRD